MINKRSLEVLLTTAEYRLLNTAQLADLHFGSDQAARRRIRGLAGEGLVCVDKDRPGRDCGRPQLLTSLSASGVKALQAAGQIPVDLADDEVTAANLHDVRDHQILGNWFRILVQRLHRERPDFEIACLSPTSPFRHQAEHRDALCIRLPREGQSEEGDLLPPDGVFTLSHTPTRRSLLFYVEVDMGTESLASPSGRQNDIRQKLINYRIALGKKLYKGCQRMVNGALNGFRVLLIANTHARAADLCRVVDEMAPMDFVWVTEPGRMFEQGVGGHIWTRGGRSGAAAQSILGSLAATGHR